MSARRRPRPRTELTFERALAHYGTHLRARRCSPKTIKEQLRELRHLRDRLGSLPLPEVTLHDLREHVTGLLGGSAAKRKEPMSAGSVARIASAIRTFFKFLEDEELLAPSPAARLERPRKATARVGDVLSVQEVTRLLRAARPDTARGLRDRLALELLYATGVRRSELLALDLGDLDRDHRDLIVAHGKGDKSRRIPVCRSAWEVLLRYLEDARPELCTSHPDSCRALLLSCRGRRFDQQSLTRLLRRAARAARLSKPVTPHTMRRSFATGMLQAGASLRHIQLLLGHEKLSTTSVYLRLDTRELRRELLLRHPRERIDA